MIRSFITMVISVAVSAVLAVFVVKVFDDWYQDCEERRAARRARNEGRYE
jgi:Tfp pilus assembly protein FimT